MFLNIKKGSKVTCSCANLFKILGEELEYSTINYSQEKNEENKLCEYFDLYNDSNYLACMDGEICEVEEVNENYVILKNNDGVIPALFTLSRLEAEFSLSISVLN